MDDRKGALDAVLGSNRWLALDPEELGTPKKVKSALQQIARLAGRELDGVGIDVKDQRADRTTVLVLGEACQLVETEKDDGFDDEMVAGLSALLRGVGSPKRFARVGEDAVACVGPEDLTALAARGLTATVLDAEDEGEAGGGGALRRPTLDDVPGEDVVKKKVKPGGPAHERKVKGPMTIGPVKVTGGATVTFDANGAVDQIVATKGALELEVDLAGKNLVLGVKGRAELRDRSWRAWGELASDVAWDDNQLHAGDEIDIADGAVAGIVLTVAGKINGRPKAAGAVVDVDRIKRS